MTLNFEPHSWYMSAAIKLDPNYNDPCERDYVGGDKYRCIVHDCDVMIPESKFYDDSNVACQGYAPKWLAYIENGNFYIVDELTANTLDGLKTEIRNYHLRIHSGYGERYAKRRLEYLRGELRKEQISYSELHELSQLAPYIASDDIELLEPAGVPEGSR